VTSSFLHQSHGVFIEAKKRRRRVALVINSDNPDKKAKMRDKSQEKEKREKRVAGWKKQHNQFIVNIHFPKGWLAQTKFNALS
jgi:hypothetical protein